MTLLDVVLFLPLVGFLLLLVLPKESSRMAAIVLSLVVFVVSLGLLMPYLLSSTTKSTGSFRSFAKQTASKKSPWRVAASPMVVTTTFGFLSS